MINTQRFRHTVRDTWIGPGSDSAVFSGDLGDELFQRIIQCGVKADVLRRLRLDIRFRSAEHAEALSVSVWNYDRHRTNNGGMPQLRAYEPRRHIDLHQVQHLV